jgi:putative transposase
VHNHAAQTRACDWFFGCAKFRPIYELFFRPLFIFFIIELGSRRVVHFGVTKSPTDEWTAQQLREATPFGKAPRFLIRNNDSKFGAGFTRVAVSSGIEVLRTPFKAPRANAFCERLLGSVRRECLDHVLIVSERHLHRVVKEYVWYYNSARPHQGIGQAMPNGARLLLRLQGAPRVTEANSKIISIPVLGGLHHDYRRAA